MIPKFALVPSRKLRRTSGLGHLAPLYAQISRGDCRLHLSEHHGDGIPGTFVRVTVSALDELHAELMDKKYKYNRPGIQDMPWGTREMTTYDPFGNRIIFVAAKSG